MKYFNNKFVTFCNRKVIHFGLISTAITLSMLSPQAMALNVRANPGTMAPNTTFTVNQDETLDGGTAFISTGSTLTNNGVSTASKFLVHGNLTNQGLLEWGSSSSFDEMFDGSIVTNLEFGTMEFGRFSGGIHTFYMQGGTLINHGLIKIVGSNFYSATDAIIDNEASGKFIVDFTGGQIGGNQTLNNNGYFEIGPYGEWSSRSAEFSHGGRSVINGEFFCATLYAFDDVKISGSGTIHSTGDIYFFDDYILAPGSAESEDIDTLTINNTSNRSTYFIDGEIEIEIAAPQSYDKLNLTGGIGLYYGARLNIVLRDGYTPQAGDAYDIINASAVTGQFAKVTLPELPNGLTWNVQYQNTGIQLLVQ